jgi:hypothetical protein
MMEKAVTSYQRFLIASECPSFTTDYCITCATQKPFTKSTREMTTIGIERRAWYECNTCHTQHILNFGIGPSYQRGI